MLGYCIRIGKGTNIDGMPAANEVMIVLRQKSSQKDPRPLLSPHSLSFPPLYPLMEDFFHLPSVSLASDAQ